MRGSWDPRPPTRSRGRGHDVLLVEQFDVGHGHGSSHGRSRIVRLAYPEVEFVELAKEAFVGWRQLEQESGQELLELNGLLELVESAGQSSADALAAAAAEYEVLERPQARERWPVGVPDGWTALFQPEAGSSAPTLRIGRSSTARVGDGARLEEEDANRLSRRRRRDGRRCHYRPLDQELLPGPAGSHDPRDGCVLPPRRRSVAVGRARSIR